MNFLNLPDEIQFKILTFVDHSQASSYQKGDLFSHKVNLVCRKFFGLAVNIKCAKMNSGKSIHLYYEHRLLLHTLCANPQVEKIGIKFPININALNYVVSRNPQLKVFKLAVNNNVNMNYLIYVLKIIEKLKNIEKVSIKLLNPTISNELLNQNHFIGIKNNCPELKSLSLFSSKNIQITQEAFIEILSLNLKKIKMRGFLLKNFNINQSRFFPDIEHLQFESTIFSSNENKDVHRIFNYCTNIKVFKTVNGFMLKNSEHSLSSDVIDKIKILKSPFIHAELVYAAFPNIEKISTSFHFVYAQNFLGYKNLKVLSLKMLESRIDETLGIAMAKAVFFNDIHLKIINNISVFELYGIIRNHKVADLTLNGVKFYKDDINDKRDLFQFENEEITLKTITLIGDSECIFNNIKTLEFLNSSMNELIKKIDVKKDLKAGASKAILSLKNLEILKVTKANRVYKYKGIDNIHNLFVNIFIEYNDKNPNLSIARFINFIDSYKNDNIELYANSLSFNTDLPFDFIERLMETFKLKEFSFIFKTERIFFDSMHCLKLFVSDYAAESFDYAAKEFLQEIDHDNMEDIVTELENRSILEEFKVEYENF